MARRFGAHRARLRDGANALAMASGTLREDGNIFVARFFGRGELKYFNHYCPYVEGVPRPIALPESRLVFLAGLYTEEKRRTSVTYNGLLPARATWTAWICA